MVSIAILLVLALVAVWRVWVRAPRPFDREEIRMIRHLGDRARQEQRQPFEW